MGTASLAQQETRRRKWIAGLVIGALAATVMTVALAYWWSSARRDKPLPAPEALPTNVHEQASGYSFTHSDGRRQIFTVHAARTIAFKEGGITVLEDVMVELFGREGNRHDVLRTHQCEYNPESGDLSSPGEVEIELNAPAGEVPGVSRTAHPALRLGRYQVFLETSRVSFQQQGSLVVTDERVQFRVGPGAGSARGMKYGTKEGWVELEKDVVLEVQPRGRSPAAPIRLAARHLRYVSPRGESGTVTLDGPLEFVQGNRRVTSQRGMVWLDSRNRLTEAVLDGDVRAFDSSEGGAMESSGKRVRAEFDPANGQLRSVMAEGGVTGESHRGGRQETHTRLEAQQFEMKFRGSHPEPQTGTASGNVRLTLDSPRVGTPGSPQRAPGDKFRAERKTLSAAQVQLVFRPDGKSLAEMDTVGAGELALLPADPHLGEREISAGRLLMAFDAQSRLETLRGLAHTRIVFHPPKDAPPGTSSQESSSERLEATFDPATQTLGQVEQVGGFRLQEGDRQARAERAQYSSLNQLFALTGHPEVSDTGTRASAEHVTFDLREDIAEGMGKVQSTHFGGPGGAEDPIHILADRMLAQRRSQFVHYEGHVRAWHGTDVVESSSLDVSRTQRRVSSGSGVVTSHFQPVTKTGGTSGPTAQNGTRQALPGETRPATIRADHLDFFDEGRRASYRGHVQLRTENTVLQADRMDVYFSNAGGAGASEIERAIGDGHVTVTQPTRQASGEHAEYGAAEGKIQLSGGHPTLDDAEKGSTTGERLTFFLHDDRLFVDGGDQSPTLFKHRVAQ